MPELPEVETVRRGLVEALEGQRLAKVVIRRADLRVPFSPRFAARLTGTRITALRRRAKYILMETDGPDTLVMHLGMSGRITIEDFGEGPGAAKTPGQFARKISPTKRLAKSQKYGPHDHVIFETEAGLRIIYSDHRRFGLMILVETDGLNRHPLFKNLGPEPLERAFSSAYLSDALRNKRTPIKAALLDQRVVAGLGNIYVCEALHHTRISPRRSASSVAGVRAQRLVPAIKKILRQAITAGGSTLRDYARTDGTLGYFQHKFAAYNRDGEACPNKDCGGTIKRLVQSGALFLVLSQLPALNPIWIVDEPHGAGRSTQISYDYISIFLSTFAAHDFNVENHRTGFVGDTEAVISHSHIDCLDIVRLSGGDGGTFTRLQALQAGIGITDAPKLKVRRTDAVQRKQFARCYGDRIPRRGQRDLFSPKIGECSYFRPDDETVDRVGGLRGNSHRIRTVQHGVNKESTRNRCDIAWTVSFDRGVITLKGGSRVAFTVRDEFYA